MKISFNKATGFFIESSSSSDDATMISNSLGMGIPLADIEIREVTEDDLVQLILSRNTSTNASRSAILQLQILRMETEQLMPRITREAHMETLIYLASGQGITEPQLYAANIGYRRLRDFDNEIIALRAKINLIA